MKVLMLGGCHTYAYGSENFSKGYYQQFLKFLNENGFEIEEISYAPIAVRAVNKLFNQKAIIPNDYDLIILQLGNYEFDSSISNFQKLFTSEKKKNNIEGGEFNQPLNEQLIAKRRSWIKNEKIDTPTRSFLKRKFSSLLAFSAKLFRMFLELPKLEVEKQYMEDLFDVLTSVSNKVVFIGVFPSRYGLRQYIRSIGNTYIKEKCENVGISYLELIDIIDSSIWIHDGAHFNEEGHEIILNRLIRLYKEKFQPRMLNV